MKRGARIIEIDKIIKYIRQEKRKKSKIAFNVGKNLYHIKKIIITRRFARKIIALWMVEAMMIVQRDK
jgi:hypothetical protein